MRKAEKSVKSGRCRVSRTVFAIPAATAPSGMTGSTGETASDNGAPTASAMVGGASGTAPASRSQQQDIDAGGGVSESWHP